MTTTGGALLASALTTALGLLTLLFSPLTPVRELGLLTAVTHSAGADRRVRGAPAVAGAVGPLPPMADPGIRI